MQNQLTDELFEVSTQPIADRFAESKGLHLMAQSEFRTQRKTGNSK